MYIQFFSMVFLKALFQHTHIYLRRHKNIINLFKADIFWFEYLF